MTHTAHRDTYTGEYTYRGYRIYKRSGEWWLGPVERVCATDVTYSLNDAKRIVDTYHDNNNHNIRGTI